MEPRTDRQAQHSIPRQGGSPEGAGEHWLVARLHEERQAADQARLTALLAGAGTGTGPWSRAPRHPAP
jgi:hypothetical protein